ncbi:MAG: PHP domain-containing protein [Nitrospiraceae bacterium]|nr:MAG: PHP domain-containing protein [Nitrospiraceae bacterium]
MTAPVIIADLHNHSTASDGEYSSSDLVSQAQKLGIKTIGMTDHDTIVGLDEFVRAGSKTGMQVITGVEVSLRFTRQYFTGSLHLLLYFTEKTLGRTEFRNDITNVLSKGRGLALVTDRVDAINREFGPEGRAPLLKRELTVDEITSLADNVTRRHFFMALSQQHGIEDKKMIDLLIGNSSPAYIPSGIDMGLLTPLLHKYEVVKVLAHPAAGSFPGDSHYKEVLPPVETVEKIMPEFLDPQIIGIDGLEVYYPGHTHEHEDLLLEWCSTYNLIVTGGSDCHDKKARPLGVRGIGVNDLNIFLHKLNRDYSDHRDKIKTRH